jgi:two-component system, NarL family, invasion response regulator UvrY
MEAPIKIIIVDDHLLVRDALRRLFLANSQFSVIKSCEDGADAIESVKQLCPDIVIMDVDMQPVNGFEATKQICSEMKTVKIIGYSSNYQPFYAAKMMELGAKGYVTKTSHGQELVNAIYKVYAGEEFICREIVDRINLGL